MMSKETENKETKPNTKVGFIADKLFKLAAKGAKKLEDYAEKSAAENNNENAKKLASVMNKFNQKLEKNHDSYIAEVDKNAINLMNKSKETLDKAKQVYSEMKTRATAAKEKADQDSKTKSVPEEKVEKEEKEKKETKTAAKKAPKEKDKA